MLHVSWLVSLPKCQDCTAHSTCIKSRHNTIESCQHQAVLSQSFCHTVFWQRHERRNVQHVLVDVSKLYSIAVTVNRCQISRTSPTQSTGITMQRWSVWLEDTNRSEATLHCQRLTVDTRLCCNSIDTWDAAVNLRPLLHTSRGIHVLMQLIIN